MSKNHFKVTPAELDTLIECVESCHAIGGGLAHEANEARIALRRVYARAKKAYQYTPRQYIVSVPDAYEGTP